MVSSLRTWRAHASVLSVVLSLGCVLVVSTACVPRPLALSSLLEPLRLLGHGLEAWWGVLWPALLYQVLFTVAALATSERGKAVALGASSASAAVLTWFVYKALGRPDVAALGATAAVAVVLAIAGYAAWRLGPGRLRWALTALAGLAAVALLGLSASDLGMRYARVGVPALLLGATAGFYAWWLALTAAEPRGRGPRLAGGAVSLLLLVAWASSRSAGADERRQVVGAFSPLGAAMTSRAYLDFDQRQQRRPMPALTQGAAAFDHYSKLPPLTADLSQLNVLLITIEATRFDETSLADPKLGTTPELAALAELGAFWFTRAYSPANGTLSSMASLLSLTYPSASELDRWQSWFGQLRPEATTVAEAFEAAGFDTFRVSHNIRKAFEHEMLGFNQGFARSVLEGESAEQKPALDERLAAAAARELEAQAASQRPFFGWVFLGGPHLPYQVHDKARPAATPRDRYRQELRFSDAQIGKLVATLRRTGLFDRTILVVAADHGEELRDHGGTGHLTLFEECLHVPLLVRVPGVAGGRNDAPTSTLYALPWLLRRHGGAPQALAVHQIERELAPMLELTGGAVIAETVAQDRMFSALILGQTKLVCGVASGWCDVYDLARDPKEQRSLRLSDPRALDPWRGVWNGYLAGRSAIGKFRTRDAPKLGSP